MPPPNNPHVEQRLTGIRQGLQAIHDSSVGMSAATRGSERETFINRFLSEVFPSHFRFGTGDATDRVGNRSGQLDVVVEYPLLPSLPAIADATSRLYLAEGIVAVIEVKSDLSNQWNAVKRTSEKLKVLRREFGDIGAVPPEVVEQIPLFAVGYRGWSQERTVYEKAQEGVAEGVLVIDSGIYASAGGMWGDSLATGDWSLWGLIDSLHHATRLVTQTSLKPHHYASANLKVDDPR